MWPFIARIQPFSETITVIGSRSTRAAVRSTPAVSGGFTLDVPFSPTALRELYAVHAGFVNFGRLDGSRTTYALADGAHIGSGPPPGPQQPILANPRCVGSSGTTMVVVNQGLLTGLTPANTAAWERGLSSPGLVRVVDGYIVVSEGSTLSMLRPN